ncbi:hypothetical protein MN116_000338 [Schistosoma mekongi]|uniref:Uncharacterized protein n=1 Tax=Schistosoma mekongi TaxID=38744 RepID=A0AAE1Z5D0_SCHME|nr:hypothetical protein MN116_000338 [Schistosoma mekongi]
MSGETYSYSSLLRQQQQHLEDSMPDLSVQLEKHGSPDLCGQRSLNEKQLEIEFSKLKIQEVEKRIALGMLLREGCSQNSRENTKCDTCAITNRAERYFELPKPEVRKFDGNPKEY